MEHQSNLMQLVVTIAALLVDIPHKGWSWSYLMPSFQAEDEKRNCGNSRAMTSFHI